MKRPVLFGLAILAMAAITVSAVAVEAAQTFEPLVFSQNARDGGTVVAADLHNVTSDQLFTLGVTVGVMSAICAMAIVIMVSGRPLTKSKSKRRLSQKHA